MEGKRFDELSKAVAGLSSRRHVVKGLVAGVVASAVGLFGRGGADAAARKRRINEVCRKPGDCEDGLTCMPADHGRDRCCTVDGSICNGRCCQTLCDPEFGCFDRFTNIACYHDCVDSLCFHMNNGFNYTTNQTFNGDYDCEFFCAAKVCGRRG